MWPNSKLNTQIAAISIEALDSPLLDFWHRLKDLYLLYLLVSMRAVIGQFTGPYSPVRPAKI